MPPDTTTHKVHISGVNYYLHDNKQQRKEPSNNLLLSFLHCYLKPGIDHLTQSRHFLSSCTEGSVLL